MSILDGLLKTEKVFMTTLDKEVVIHELPYKAQMEMSQSHIAEDGMAGAITVKYALGLDEPVEEVAALITIALVQEVTEKLVTLMPFDMEELEGNSESTQADNSASH